MWPSVREEYYALSTSGEAQPEKAIRQVHALTTEVKYIIPEFSVPTRGIRVCAYGVSPREDLK